jgi:hypothetical protein
MFVGKIAQDRLSRVGKAWVMGLTSRGLFLRLEGEGLVYLTDEPYRGPLTLNLDEAGRFLAGCQAGSVVEISAGKIIFPDQYFLVRLDGAIGWQAPDLPGKALPNEARWARLVQTAQAALRLKAEQGGQTATRAGLAGHLLGILGREVQPVDMHFSGPLKGLQAALHEGKDEAVTASLGRFLGLGEGLTPSGDDLVLGFLLAANRWWGQLNMGLDQGRLNQTLVEAAFRKTTLLSANLIEAACLGQADERLVAALDGLMSGEPDAAECARLLAGWGSSSGVDALCGMGLALSG